MSARLALAFLFVVGLTLARARGSDADWTYIGHQLLERVGRSVSRAGDVNGDGIPDLLIGCPGFANQHPNAGRVLAFHGSLSGPSLTPQWAAEGEADHEQLGISVDGAGDLNGDGYADIVVGSWGVSSPIPSSARVFLGSAAGLSTTPAWVVTDDDRFGWSVAAAGDVNGDGFGDFIVGAPDHQGYGTAFVYAGSSSGPSLAPIWTESGTSLDFAQCVAGAGDVNADGFNDLLISASDRTFLYTGSPSGPATEPAWSWWVSSAFSFPSATAGDLNGDGFDDAIVGDPDASTSTGAAFLFLGSATGLATSPASELHGEGEGDGFGYSVASLDVNGDHFSDVLIGSPGWDASSDRGRAYCYVGSSTGLNPTVAWRAEGVTLFESFGIVSGAGDVNGDGRDDILVGAPGFGDHPFDNVGSAMLYLGSPSVTFEPFGEGLAGAAGLVPDLSGSGLMGWRPHYAIRIDRGLGATTGIVWVGLEQADYHPFYGGHFYVDFTAPWVAVPVVLQGVPELPGTGSLDLVGPDLRPYAGIDLYLQATLSDPAAMHGISITNALRLAIGR